MNIVVSVSSVQQSDSVVYIHVSGFFQILFSLRLNIQDLFILN